MPEEDSNYQIIFSPQARRSLRKLPPNIQQRVNDNILALAENPRPPGVKALQGARGLLRLRVGEYRVVYRIEDRQLIVVVVQVGHRHDIYRQG